jgi:hypothetical protein
MQDAAGLLLQIAEHAGGPSSYPFFIAGLSSASPQHSQKCSAVLQQVLQRLCPSIDSLATVDAALSGASTNYCFRWLVTSLAAAAASQTDGGWGMVFICCKLIERVLQDFPFSPHIRLHLAQSRTVREISGAFFQLADEARRIIAPGACSSIPLSLHRIQNTSSFVELLINHMRLGSTVVSVSREEEEHVAALLVDCVVKTSNRHGHLNPHKLRMATILSGQMQPLLGSRVLDGIVIDWSLPLEAQVMQACGRLPVTGPCVVFESDLSWHEQDRWDENPDVDRASVVELLLSAVPGGVAFVMSQRTIDPRIREALAERCGAVAVERLSIRHIDAVCAATGSSLLHSPADLADRLRRGSGSGVGFVESLSAMEGSPDGRRQFMVLRSRAAPDSSSVVTLLLRVSSPAVVENVECKVKSGFRVMCSLLAHGAWLVNGNGSFESEMVLALRRAHQFAVFPERERALGYLQTVVEHYEGLQSEWGQREPTSRRDEFRAKAASFLAALETAASALQINTVVVGGECRSAGS